MIATVIALTVAAQLPTEIKSPIEVPFRIVEDGDAMIVDALVNGKKCSFMYDSGFSGELVINDRLNIGKSSGKMRLRDFVGEFEADVIEVESLTLGNLKIPSKAIQCVQMPTASFTESYGTHCDGIMGFEVTSPYVTEINFERQRFIFHPKSTDITKRVPDGKRSFLVRLEDHGNNSLELKCEINGKPLTLALDTGNAFYTATHKEVLERVGAWDPKKKPEFMTQTWVASGPVDSWSILLKDTKIFGVPVPESVWGIIDLPSSSAEGDGTVGFQFLKNFNITIDHERRYVWLENFTGKVHDAPLAQPGFYVGKTPQGRYEIFRVYTGGPADKAGIKEGDFLMMVDGKSLSTIQSSSLRPMLFGPEGSTIKVVTSRNGVLARHELVRRLMVNR